MCESEWETLRVKQKQQQKISTTCFKIKTSFSSCFLRSDMYDTHIHSTCCLPACLCAWNEILDGIHRNFFSMVIFIYLFTSSSLSFKLLMIMMMILHSSSTWASMFAFKHNKKKINTIDIDSGQFLCFFLFIFMAFQLTF